MDRRDRPQPAPTSAEAYRFELPPELIAQEPAPTRDAARLLSVLANGEIEHATFADFPSQLLRGDVLVVNETRVIRARLRGVRTTDDGPAEVLLLRPVGGGPFDPTATAWNVLMRPGAKLRVGTHVRFGSLGSCEVTALHEDGSRDVRFDLTVPLAEALKTVGEVPLPPYIDAPLAAEADPHGERYQTVFGRVTGSVAAPTASLHFTEEVLAKIRARGVVVAPIVLHIGRGTFKPIDAGELADHRMHSEWYAIPDATAEAIAAAQIEGNRIVAAGTSVVRALEASALRAGAVIAGDAETDLFIRPGFSFQVVDALLTNFHMPSSPLLVLLSAFLGYENVRAVYAAAIERRYRFYSFGDAMFIARRGIGRVVTNNPGALDFSLAGPLVEPPDRNAP